MTGRFDPALLPPAPTLEFEAALWARGITSVGGIDEAGRGAWAGPVFAAVLILPPCPEPIERASLAKALVGVRDSKQMTPAQREEWAEKIKDRALAWGVGQASSLEIDALGILPATLLAARRALERLPFPPGHLLIDYFSMPAVSIPQTCLVKGDARALSIAGASVLAKTARDAVMRQLDLEFPGYGLARHKGYGTAAHLAALKRLGPSPVHRFSFAPMAQISATIPAARPI
jgi:ribonuclease HII